MGSASARPARAKKSSKPLAATHDVINVPQARSGDPKVLVDHVGMVAEFLNEVDLIDIIIELVQNELDAGSTRTVIELENHALRCAGTGSQMDDKGWERLGYVLGAGALVEAKIDGIGSKNHGIRACFLLGDEITVQSNGMRVDLTAKGSPTDPEAFYPAGWGRERDRTAPRKGVQVVVPLRTRELAIPGQAPLAPCSPATLDQLFEEALQVLPERFLTASAPAKPWRYEIVLQRRKRIVRLLYTAKPGGVGPFTLRTCSRSTSNRPERLVTARACHPFRFKPEAGDVAKVPRLFRDGETIWGELAWSIDPNSDPITSGGTYRYPIALPVAQAGNPFGFDVSGPFVTGKARHSLGRDRRNEALLATAQAAFVDLMRDQLVPRYGPQALVLLQSSGASDPARVSMLAGELLMAGALPRAIATSKAGARDHDLTLAGGPVLLPSPSYRHGALDRAIVPLASSDVQLLHPATPPSAVAALRHWGVSNTQCGEFTEVGAARSTFIEGAPALGSIDKTWLGRVQAALAMLDLAQRNGTLDSRILAELAAKGRLPSDENIAREWSELRQAKVNSLRIPGVEPPPLVHPKLKAFALLRRGPTMIGRFDLDKFLATLNFAKAGAQHRAAFFQWLRRNHSSVSPKTLSAIGDYPIWPDVGGTFRALSSFCVPRKPYLREALSQVLPMPSEVVLRFPGLRAASNGALRLRIRPTSAELQAWHEAKMAAVETLAHSRPEAAIASVNEIEALLEQMREDGYSPREFSTQHLSLDQLGTLRPIADLHVESAAVNACALLAQDLAQPGLRPLRIALGAQLAPSADAVLRALRAAPDRARLAARLSAYKNAGRPLSELGGEAIVPEQDELLCPDDLAIHLPVDHWGKWKRRVQVGDLSPDEVKLLEEAGMARAPREESARGFFTWLARQSPATLIAHRAQIIRLWLDRRAGPTRWVTIFPHLPCLLVRDGKRQPALLAPRMAAAQRALVFVPDLRALEGQILAELPRVRLAVVDCDTVDGSALAEIASTGVKSLAAAVGAPVGLSLLGETRSEPTLDLELDRLRRPRVRNHLKTALPRHGVPGEALDRRWRSTLGDISGVRVAMGLEAIYQFSRRSFPAPIASGYDPHTKQICVAQAHTTIVDFYDAIASRIFVEGSPPTYAHGLLHAVRELDQASSTGSLFDGFDHDREEQGGDNPGGESTDEPSGAPGGAGKTENGSGDNRKGHGLSDDAKPFVPKPNPLGKLTSLTFPKGGKKRQQRKPASTTDQQRHSIEEDAQIQKLKHDHYALHCQACIGPREVLEAAPPESYVYGPGFRRSLIHAHHVKLLVNQTGKSPDEVAGQGAGNLLILCRYHHGLLGDQLSRPMVLAGLREATKVDRHFPDKHGVLSGRPGLLVNLTLAKAPHKASLYFTREHQAAWFDY